jgi:hypothetical protein
VFLNAHIDRDGSVFVAVNGKFILPLRFEDGPQCTLDFLHVTSKESLQWSATLYSPVLTRILIRDPTCWARVGRFRHLWKDVDSKYPVPKSLYTSIEKATHWICTREHVLFTVIADWGSV